MSAPWHAREPDETEADWLLRLVISHAAIEAHRYKTITTARRTA